MFNKSKNTLPYLIKFVCYVATCILVLKSNSQTFKFTDTTFEIGNYYEFKYTVNLDHGACTTYPCYEYNKLIYDSLIHFLNTHPTFKIEIGLRIDTPTSDTNSYLFYDSHFEAIGMKKNLVYFGIDKERISIKGYQNAEPLINQTEVSKPNQEEQIDVRFTNTRIIITLIFLK